jgi:hypothetical protein
MFRVSLDALKQAIGIVAETSKDGSANVAKSSSSLKSSRKSKKLGHKPLESVVSLTQKLGPTERA